MASDHDTLRELLSSASLGYTAYRAWGQQARRERRFNIARLFEALAAAKEIRAEQALRSLGEIGSTRENLERARAGLQPNSVACGPVTGTTALSRELMGRGLQALTEGRDLKASELGDIYVCGSCGELRENEPTQICPVCGTVPEGHLSFRTVEAMGVLGPTGITAILEHTEETLRALTDGLNLEQLAERHHERPSMNEIIGHLIDMDGVFRERAWLILETEQPELPAAHPPTLSAAAIYRFVPRNEILARFRSSRLQTLSLLRGLTTAAWRRVGHHEIFGAIPLTHQGNWVVSHERGHLVELAQMRYDLMKSREEGVEPPPRMVPEVQQGM